MRLPGEEKALKGQIPRAPLARNKARRARGGVQGVVAVRNRARRLPGGGISGLTGLPEPHASKGDEPHERCRDPAFLAFAVERRPVSVTLRRGDKATEGWFQIVLARSGHRVRW